MVTQSTLAGTTRRSMLGQLGLLLLIGVALGVFGMYALETYPGGTGAAKSDSHHIIGAFQPSSGQDVLSVEWLEQHRATKAVVSSNVKPQNDVLSVEWLEQHRQGNRTEANVGSRAAQPVPDNYIGYIE